MPQCKKSGCREPAVPYGKRYCIKHKEEYLERRKRHQERARNAKKCVVCGEAPVFRDDMEVCSECRKRKEDKEILESQFRSFMELPDSQKWAYVYHLLTR